MAYSSLKIGPPTYSRGEGPLSKITQKGEGRKLFLLHPILSLKLQNALVDLYTFKYYNCADDTLEQAYIRNSSPFSKKTLNVNVGYLGVKRTDTEISALLDENWRPGTPLPPKGTVL